MEISIDTSDIAREFSLSESEASDMVDFAVKGITTEFAKQWEIQAQRELHSVRDIYKRSIYVGDSGKYTGFVQLRGVLPNMIESGAAAYDMKPGFLSSPKAKQSKGGGVYFTVPFRWATSGSSGGSAFSGIMPKIVESIAKRNKPSIYSEKGMVQRGIGIKKVQLPAELQLPKKPTNKAPIHVGIVHETKTYEKSTGGKFTSFRRISNKSDPMSWIHSGFVARNLAEKALKSMDLGAEVDRQTDVFLKQLGF